ncbi:hypothetical protein COCON_G00100590 [Conger conger]|uniref:C2H2-type domain-containing protein n=1 Tax=Conger conger TaxID=82655 RepID=A0A9Q1HZ43_CONCO|nr:hypothetical protein COCON_G00100590 [Conger conger]
MSDAILTFQMQLSAVMETVLKSAMYEITRLVEDSFLEEVARSKQEVEALRQRLQWWESRRRERESGGRARCVDCGRAGVSSQETEDPPSGTPSGVEEGRGLKQEKVPEGSWSSCSGGTQNALEEEATPSSLRDLDLSSTAPTDSDGERPDSLLKEEGEEPQEMSGGDDVQGKWLLCPEGETLPGAEGAPPLPLSKGCGEPEWSPAVRQDTAPSSDSLLAEQSSRAAAGESCGSYESQGQEGSARSLSLAGPQRCGRHWQRPAWTPFKLGDSDSEPDGLGELQQGAEFSGDAGESDAQAACATLQPASEHSPGPRPLNAAPNMAAIKQEVGAASAWGGRADPGDVYPQLRQPAAEAQGHKGTDPPALRNCVSRHEQLPKAVSSQPKPPGCVPSARHAPVRATDRTGAVTHSSAGVYSKASAVSRSAQAHPRALAGERRLGSAHFGKGVAPVLSVRSHLRPNMERAGHSCTQCGKSFSHFSHLKAHQQTHTGERPFCCSLCGRSFTKLSNLKAHRRVHTGERPYSCTECGKRFTQKCNLKRHQRIHAAERLFSCK